MSTHFTLDFWGIWEHIYNPNFNRMKFHTVKTESGRLVLTLAGADLQSVLVIVRKTTR